MRGNLAASDFITNSRYPYPCCDPSQGREVRKLNEMNYRKWMVLIGAAMLLIAIIRLWIGILFLKKETRRSRTPAGLFIR